MKLPLVDRAALVVRLAQIAQLEGTYGSKTDQTAQTDRRVENQGKFAPPLARTLTTRHSKLTSGTAQQPNLCVQVVGAPLDSTPARPSDGAPHS
jgi:hypothetical protein